MHFQFLIEDRSGEALIHQIMSKYLSNKPHITYGCKSFHGIGHFKKGPNPKNVKTQTLLTDLSIFLKGFEKSLRGIPATIVVVVDNDDRNPEEFRKQLEQVAASSMIMIDHIFCIAIEEMEAWLLGDRQAIEQAYPHARFSLLNDYVQDSICGTWEKLASALYKGGLKQFKKDCPTFRQVGTYKLEWAERIGQYLNLENNKSPSFQYFIRELNKRIS